MKGVYRSVRGRWFAGIDETKEGGGRYEYCIFQEKAKKEYSKQEAIAKV